MYHSRNQPMSQGMTSISWLLTWTNPILNLHLITSAHELYVKSYKWLATLYLTINALTINTMTRTEDSEMFPTSFSPH